jgi:hypothetical protein
MKLTATQLRKIISEEVKNLTQMKLGVTSGGVGSVGKYGTADLPAEKSFSCEECGSTKEPLVSLGKTVCKSCGHTQGEKADPVKIQVAGRVRSGKKISEGHARITEEEMAAWKSGDWGFDSQIDSSANDSERFLHGFESGHPMDDEGYMVKSRMADIKEMAETICSLLEMGDQLPAWVQDLVASSHTDLEHVKDYLVGDEKMRSYSGKSSPSMGAEMMPVVGESRGRGGMLLEGHARITPEEMAAWMGGDWGYVSESLDGTPTGGVPGTCNFCGEEVSEEEAAEHSKNCKSAYSTDE